MLESIKLSDYDIPCGILHDQQLETVKCENNNLIFTFNIQIDDDFDNWNDLEFSSKYKNFSKCNLIVKLQNDPFNYFDLQTAPKYKSGKFKGLELGREEFIDVINNASAVTFVECFVNEVEFKLEHCVGFFAAKGKYRKYKKYDMCALCLGAEAVSFEWE